MHSFYFAPIMYNYTFKAPNTPMFSKFLFCLLSLITLTSSFLKAQHKVAITIGDTPNTRQYQADGYEQVFLDTLDALKIPVAAFINEGKVYKTSYDAISKNKGLLENWVKRDYVTLGNHTFSHYKYSTTDFQEFEQDLRKGAYMTEEFATKYNKTIRYYRAPFNDLGKDSTQHTLMYELLKELNYISTPFTVESSDWMFNFIYEHYMSEGNHEEAKKIGELYVEKTLKYFDFFEKLSVQKYDRNIAQIYLCHDNLLNTHYLGKLKHHLSTKGYSFVSLDEALTDEVYAQDFVYHKKWGVSWLYRWMPTQKERIKFMRSEPEIEYIEQLYNQLSKSE